MKSEGMLSYFWSEKGDVTRWARFEEWAKANPQDANELARLLREMEYATDRVTDFIRRIEDREDAE